VAWLRQRAGHDLDYWREALAGSRATSLPRRASASAADLAYGERERALSASASAAVQAAARRHQVTVNSMVQAAWGLVLAQITGQRDVLFGATVAGRPAGEPHATTTIGLFINTLPVRARIPAATTTGAAWLRALQEEQAIARQFEHVSLRQLKLAGQEGARLFDSVVVFESFPELAEPASQSLALTQLRSFVREAYPLVAIAFPGDALRLQVKGAGGWLDEADVARIAELWQLALERLASDGDAALPTIAEAIAARDAALRQEQRQASREENRRQLRELAQRRQRER
jgi:non-ribosomal peptide synthetase component F